MKKLKKCYLALIVVLFITLVMPNENTPSTPVAFAEKGNSYLIKDSDRPPHNVVGKLLEGNVYGTGFVIGDNTVLTNKHVAKKMKVNSSVFKLGLNGGNHGKKLLGEYIVTGMKYPPNVHDDVAILTVRSKNGSLPLSKVVKPANIANANFINKDWMKTEQNNLHIAGYPGNRNTNMMWGSSGHLLDYAFKSDRIFVADFDGYPGSSGSPVFDSQNQVIGIHNSDYGTDSGRTGGFLFKDDLYEFIVNNR
ncbi:trypsin-like peptidase domain-containing protein [Staphylococcus pseudintermedius]|nr:trypsin-like peptidase domain-containing protein [Staphylococcus pseudintermedius]